MRLDVLPLADGFVLFPKCFFVVLRKLPTSKKRAPHMARSPSTVEWHEVEKILLELELEIARNEELEDELSRLRKSALSSSAESDVDVMMKSHLQLIADMEWTTLASLQQRLPTFLSDATERIRALEDRLASSTSTGCTVSRDAVQLLCSCFAKLIRMLSQCSSYHPCGKGPSAQRASLSAPLGGDAPSHGASNQLPLYPTSTSRASSIGVRPFLAPELQTTLRSLPLPTPSTTNALQCQDNSSVVVPSSQAQHPPFPKGSARSAALMLDSESDSSELIALEDGGTATPKFHSNGVAVPLYRSAPSPPVAPNFPVHFDDPPPVVIAPGASISKPQLSSAPAQVPAGSSRPSSLKSPSHSNPSNSLRMMPDSQTALRQAPTLHTARRVETKVRHDKPEFLNPPPAAPQVVAAVIIPPDPNHVAPAQLLHRRMRSRTPPVSNNTSMLFADSPLAVGSPHRGGDCTLSPIATNELRDPLFKKRRVDGTAASTTVPIL